MAFTGSKLEKILLKSKIITKEQLDSAKKESKKTKKPFHQILINKRIVSEEDIAKVCGDALEIPFIDLSGKSISKETLFLIPEKIAKKYQAIAFKKEGKAIKIAMKSPEDFQAIEFLEKKLGKEIEPYIGTSSDINRILDQYVELQTEIEKTIEKIDPEISAQELENPEALQEIIKQDAPIPRLVNTLIERAVKSKASDIHIEPGREELKVRCRIDGVLQQTVRLPKKIHAALISRIKILSKLKIDEKRIPQDGRFHATISGKEVDFRVSSLPTVNGEKVVMRILDISAGILTLEQLGVRGKGFKTFSENIKKPHGMTLVTGPTGSGKTTTLYAILDKINKVGVNIITLEDPVEYYIEGISQSQIKSSIGYDFANGLRSIVRQDPDIIMVGEIRDKETAGMAVHAALTGHIVLSTLHTNNAAGAIPRLIDMKIEPFLIASSVNTVVGQRLVRKICPHCRKQYELSNDILNDIRVKIEIKKMPKQNQKLIDIKKSIKLYKGTGCDQCNETGYKGRIGIFEVLSVTQTIERLLLKRAPASEIQEKATQEGMITMKQDGILKVLDGITTLEEVWRVTVSE